MRRTAPLALAAQSDFVGATELAYGAVLTRRSKTVAPMQCTTGRTWVMPPRDDRRASGGSTHGADGCCRCCAGEKCSVGIGQLAGEEGDRSTLVDDTAPTDDPARCRRPDELDV